MIKKIKIKSKFIKNRIILLMAVIFCCSLLLTSCSGVNMNSDGVQSTSADISKSSADTRISVEYDSYDEDSGWEESSVENIVLSENSISSASTGVSINGNKATISTPGTYRISGTLKDGQIIIHTLDEGIVRLVLDGASITCSDNPPVYVNNAKKVILVLAEGSDNSISDGSAYNLENMDAGEPYAAVFSKSDLTVNGNGSLTVNGNYKNGITSKDGLKIINGKITVHAAADAIRGRDYVSVKNGEINIDAKSDGIQSNNDEDAQKGFVYISGGSINITAGMDAVQAETALQIDGGNLTVCAGGGSVNGVEKTSEQPGMGKAINMERSPDENSAEDSSSGSENSVSTKGIKAGTNITVNEGTIKIDSADDAINSNDKLVINDGNISIESGEDGIHSDKSLEINGGDITLSKSYEGIESTNITINDGNIRLTSSDDGINVSGSTSGGNYLTVNGGYAYVDASGDGIDVNGSVKITGGTVIVNGPENNGNGALDYDGAFEMTGGLLVAAGSSGMAQAPDTSSTQYSVMVNFSSALAAGTVVHIETEDGKDILSFAPTKEYQSLVLCSPGLEKGASYNIYYGGSADGTSKDGLYNGGTYTAGTKFDSFTVSDIVTNVGTVSGGMRGGGFTRPGK